MIDQALENGTTDSGVGPPADQCAGMKMVAEHEALSARYPSARLARLPTTGLSLPTQATSPSDGLKLTDPSLAASAQQHASFLLLTLYRIGGNRQTQAKHALPRVP